MLRHGKFDQEVFFLLLLGVDLCESNSWSGRLRELKNKGKDQLVIAKSGRGRLRERSLTRAFHYRV